MFGIVDGRLVAYPNVSGHTSWWDTPYGTRIRNESFAVDNTSLYWGGPGVATGDLNGDGVRRRGHRHPRRGHRPAGRATSGRSPSTAAAPSSLYGGPEARGDQRRRRAALPGLQRHPRARMAATRSSAPPWPRATSTGTASTTWPSAPRPRPSAAQRAAGEVVVALRARPTGCSRSPARGLAARACSRRAATSSAPPWPRATSTATATTSWSSARRARASAASPSPAR